MSFKLLTKFYLRRDVLHDIYDHVYNDYTDEKRRLMTNLEFFLEKRERTLKAFRSVERAMRYRYEDIPEGRFIYAISSSVPYGRGKHIV